AARGDLLEEFLVLRRIDLIDAAAQHRDRAAVWMLHGAAMGRRIHAAGAAGDDRESRRRQQSGETLRLLAPVIRTAPAADQRKGVEVARLERSLDVKHRRRVRDRAQQQRIGWILRTEKLDAKGF